MQQLTAERLRELLHYDPQTGVFYWKADRCCGNGRVSVEAGSRAGWIDKDGYSIVGIDGRKYFAHRLAWLYMTAAWPSDEIDHQNIIKSDNRWSNLRKATHSQNSHNKRTRRDSAIGLKGVSFHRRDQLYCARIMVGKKRIVIGYFKSAAYAYVAYIEAAKKYHGEFARVE